MVETNDPTAHAEIVAIRKACQRLSRFDLKDCILYTSCEPCPMCLSAIYWARLDALYFAASSHDAADAGFDDSVLYEEISRPMMERNLRAEQHLQIEARQVMKAWMIKPDKQLY